MLNYPTPVYNPRKDYESFLIKELPTKATSSSLNRVQLEGIIFDADIDDKYNSPNAKGDCTFKLSDASLGSILIEGKSIDTVAVSAILRSSNITGRTIIVKGAYVPATEDVNAYIRFHKLSLSSTLFEPESCL